MTSSAFSTPPTTLTTPEPSPAPEPKRTRRPLAEAIDFRLSETLRYDLAIAALGLVGGAVRWGSDGVDMPALIGVAAGLVGVVIGAGIAVAAIQAAFLDRGFLLKIRYLGYKPTHFLAPALYTGVLGVAAALSTLVAAAWPTDWPTWTQAAVGGTVGFLATYTLASLIPVLRMVVEFTELRATAALIDDDDPRIQP